MSSYRNLCRGMVVGVLILAVAGCGSDDSDDGSTASSKAASTPFVGTQWLLDDSTDLGVPIAGVSVTAEFDDGRMAGNSGCNSYSAPYETAGDELTIGPDIASTRMACEPARNAVEAAYLKRLPQVRSYEISDKTLTLRGSGSAALLVFQASEGATEILGKWIATSYYTGTAVQSVVSGSTLTADFSAGQVAGEGGCISFSGPSEVTGRSIKLGPFLTTLKACADPELQTQQQAYLAALELATTYRVTGDRLELFREDGGIAATFERDAAVG